MFHFKDHTSFRSPTFLRDFETFLNTGQTYFTSTTVDEDPVLGRTVPQNSNLLFGRACLQASCFPKDEEAIPELVSLREYENIPGAVQFTT